MTARLNYNYAVPMGQLITKGSGRITTVRLPDETRQNLEFLAKVLKKTKTEVIIEAINMYYEKEDNELDSYTLGLPFFPKEGDPGSGLCDHAENHKKYYRESMEVKFKKEREEWDKYVEELILKKKKAKERKARKAK